jgi:RHS repeat-associated protein
MRIIIIMLIVCAAAAESLSQTGSSNQNFILTNTVQVEGIQTGSAVNALPIGSRTQRIQYVDGLGRPLQSVSTQGSPLRKDLVQPFMFDEFGRESYKFLPYVSADGSGNYKANALGTFGYYASDHATFYNGSDATLPIDASPFSLSKFDSSPLNRTVKRSAPGAVWQPDNNNSYASTDRTVKNSYEFNGTNEVLLWTYSPPTSTYPMGHISPGITSPQYYGPNQLYKNKTKDEQHHETIEYINKEGLVVLKRVQTTESQAISDSNYASTYYIYDDFNNVVCIIPPEATRRITQESPSEYFNKSISDQNDFLKRWSFRYAYDGRNRLTHKQVPGTEPVYMVYDNRDRVVLTQDGNQRLVNEWAYLKYDQINRTIMTGVYTHSQNVSQEVMSGFISATMFSETYNGDASTHGYTNSVWPTTGLQLLTAAYYDNYSFVTPVVNNGNSSITTFDYASTDVTGQYIFNPSGSPKYFPYTKGRLCGLKVRILDSNIFLFTVNYYDSKYRVVQSIESNHGGGYRRTTSRLDFSGKVSEVKRTYLFNNVQTVIQEKNTYDHVGRHLLTKHSVNGGAEIVISGTYYNELGQMIKRGQHSANYPAIDPQIGQPGVVHSATIERSDCVTTGTQLVATNSIRLLPGFCASSGTTFSARIGFTEQEAHPAALPTYAQVVDYRYNIRGWMTRINNSDIGPVADGNATGDYFGMDLGYYNSITGLAGPTAYNGNITSMKWSKGVGTGMATQAYTVEYDAMDRVKNSNHYDYLASTAQWLSNSNGYSEYTAYDLNGNIKSMERLGYKGEPIDYLTYFYSGNQLNYVNDSYSAIEGFANGNSGTDDYDYDPNGNMIRDKNKGIANSGDIRYNYMNLPKEVIKGTEKIQFMYDAMGHKLSQSVYNGSTLVKKTDYVGELVFEGATPALQYARQSEGRIVLTSAPEYQYDIKDHLGTVRVTYTTKSQASQSFTANLEDGTSGSGEGVFGSYNSYTNNLMDHTDVGTLYSKVHQLNGYVSGTYNGKVGMTKSLVVMPGDVISASVYGRYDGNTGNGSPTSFITGLATAFEVSSGSVGEQLRLYNGLNSFAGMVPNGEHPNDDDAAPKAFITILLFDNKHNLLNAAWDQITTTGAQTHDLLSASITAQEAGFAYIFLSNENPTNVNVYFDDLTVTHVPSPIILASDHYPFGLAYNSYQRQSGVKAKLQYQSQTRIEDLGLGWDAFKWRNYQPDLGRFFNIDPLANSYAYSSPYGFSENDVVSSIELEGLERFKHTNYSPAQSRELVKQLKLFNEKANDYFDKQRIDAIDEIQRITEYGYWHGFVDDNGKASDYIIRKLKEAGVELPFSVLLNGSTVDEEVIDPNDNYTVEYWGVEMDENGNISGPKKLGEIRYHEKYEYVRKQVVRAAEVIINPPKLGTNLLVPIIEWILDDVLDQLFNSTPDPQQVLPVVPPPVIPPPPDVIMIPHS